MFKDLPKGYRLLRNGEPFPVNYWYRYSREGGDKDISSWKYCHIEENAENIERFRKRVQNNWIIILKKDKS